jgi:hypothetical protein
MSGYPRPVRDIHQIELTTICNLRCKYCPSPHLDEPKEKGGYGRAKMHMEWPVFLKALDVVKHFVRKGTQTELSLTGIGESLLHPRFVEMVAAARGAIGPDRPLVVTTNGIGFDEDLALLIKPFRPMVYVSLHRPEMAGPAVEVAKKHGMLSGVNASAVTAAFNWAGQVKWHVSAPKITCEYLKAGWGVILVDGRVTTCCLDADGAGVVGTVYDDPDSLRLKPYAHCDGCHMKLPTEAELVA